MWGWLFGITCVICLTVVLCKSMDSEPKKSGTQTLNTTMADGYEPPTMRIN